MEFELVARSRDHRIQMVKSNMYLKLSLNVIIYMNDYMIKYASSGLAVLFTQLRTNNTKFVEFIDPLCTIIKLGLLSYKPNGTKISIKNKLYENR